MQFMFDYVSPYAYLASTRVRGIAARHGREVEAVPVVFGALLSAHGTRGPAEIPAKREYLFADIVRLARSLAVPLEPPATHPFNPLAALRATIAVDDPALRWALVDALYRAAWVEARRIDEPEVVAEVARGVGLYGATIASALSSPDARERLRASTAAAVAAGVFGVPTVLAAGEIFWGVDSLPHLDAALGGAGALDPEVMARWRAVAPSVVRKAAG